MFLKIRSQFSFGRLGWLLALTGLLLIGLAACGSDDASPTDTGGTDPTSIPTIELNELVPPDGESAGETLSTPPPLPYAMDAAVFPIDVPTGDAFDQGRQLYNQHCSECHGVEGEGQQPDPSAPGMAPPHTDAGHTWHHPDQMNFNTVWGGTMAVGGNMPAFHQELSPDEITLVLGYIKHWWSEESFTVQRDRTLALKEQAGQ